VRATITGPRNAGKSSLYNALLGEERALVSPIPGTTRDILRERIHIGGFTYYLEDTAGLAEAGCEVEKAGIRRGRAAVGAADLVIFVVDGSIGWTKASREELDALAERNHIVVVSKEDLESAEPDPLETSPAGPDRTVSVSAITGGGLGRLREMIFDHTASGDATSVGRERIALNLRQGRALRRAEEALENLERCLVDRQQPEILSVEIKEALDACGEVTGRTASIDILDDIFSKFCIGK
jgi:tRNA modification GTPase